MFIETQLIENALQMSRGLGHGLILEVDSGQWIVASKNPESG
jgi:hypothetical protein